jgi:hypothetical protein
MEFKKFASGVGGVNPVSVDVITLLGGNDGNVNGGVIVGTVKLIMTSLKFNR